MIQAYLDRQQIYRKRRKLRVKIYFEILLFILFCILIFYLSVYSPIFRIKEFKIIGAEYLIDDGVVKILEPLVLKSRLDNFLGIKNLLVWNISDLDVSGTALAEVNIDRDWLRQILMITVKERERFAIWCGSNSRCYWIDKNGVAFEEAPETQGSLILTVYDNGENNVIKGEKIFEARFINNLIAILKGILDLKIPAKKITFNEKLQEIQVISYAGPNYFFSIRFDPDPNLVSLKLLERKVDLNKAVYVDLRVDKRIFYKL